MEKTTLLSRLVPSTLLGRTLLFFLMPLTLVLCTLWAALSHPSPFPPYFSGLLLLGIVVSVRYRLRGLLCASVLLLIALACFYGAMEPIQRLGQGALCCAALDR